jgi:hypothetical protein
MMLHYGQTLIFGGGEMKNIYTIKEEKVYVVYKNDFRDKSFPTLKEAEKYKNQKEEEENGANKFDFQTILAMVLISFSVLGILIGWCFQKCDDKMLGYFIAMISGLLFGSFILYFFIKCSIDTNLYSRNKRLGLAFLTNILFSGIPIVFVFIDTESLSESLAIILTLIIFIVTFFLLNLIIKINKGDDLSPLKATNYIVVFLFTAIKLLEKKFCPGEKDFSIEYYYLLPLLLAQALYELFDGKSKVNDENKATPIQSQEEEKK